jgi:hypothetical protein
VTFAALRLDFTGATLAALAFVSLAGFCAGVGGRLKTKNVMPVKGEGEGSFAKDVPPN